MEDAYEAMNKSNLIYIDNVRVRPLYDSGAAGDCITMDLIKELKLRMK